MTRPFDGAITTFFEDTVPENVREGIETAGKNDILNPSYPHRKRMKTKQYEHDLARLQIELVKMQAWAKDTSQRIAIVFEGRDAAGKGGTISRFRTNLNPRVANVVALSNPTGTEAAQWYFQRYIKHLPSGGHITFFDRSWYNRAVVEHVFGFCDVKQRTTFFKQVNDFEKMVTGDGVKLFKFWLNVGRAVLNELSDTGKDVHNIGKIDQKILGGPDIWNA